MKESHAQAPDGLSLSFLDFVPPMFLFYFSSFSLYFPFSFHFSKWNRDIREYTVGDYFEVHAELDF